MTPGAVVIGAHANGLGIVRSLAARGLRPALVTTRPYDVAQASRLVSERAALPQLHESHDALVELLEDRARAWNGAALFPSNDDAATALARNHERLSRSYRLTVGPWEQMRPLLEKDAMQDLARRVGLALPRCLGTTDAVRVDEVRDYPVVVKPMQHDRLISRHGTKLFLARDAGELHRALSRLREAGLAGLVDEFVPGADSEIFVCCLYVDAAGEPSPAVTVRKLRQNPPRIGGARAALVVDPVPELAEATLALLRAARFRGLAFAEWKRDARDGRFRFIEVNGRAVLFNAILPPTGVDLVAMAYDDFAGVGPPRARPTAWRGAWVHAQADVACWLRYRDEERVTLGEWLRPYARSHRHAVWSASDPGPFLRQTRLALAGLRRGSAATHA